MESAPYDTKFLISRKARLPLKRLTLTTESFGDSHDFYRCTRCWPIGRIHAGNVSR